MVRNLLYAIIQKRYFMIFVSICFKMDIMKDMILTVGLVMHR